MNLRQLVLDKAASYAANDIPFTSGHITAALRTDDPTLIFASRTVGAILRDELSKGMLAWFKSTGDIVMVTRYTTGLLGRTPAGTEVTVYAPDQTTGDTCVFEVDIPSPPVVAPIPATQPAGSTPVTTPSTYTAYVLGDGRCWIPAGCLQAAGIQGFATVDLSVPNTVKVTTGDVNTFTHKVQAGNGRVAFVLPGTNPGDKFPLNVAPGCIDFTF